MTDTDRHSETQVKTFRKMGNFPPLVPHYKTKTTAADMAGKVVLVYGASSGLGRELAMIYAGRQCKLVLTGLDEHALKETRALIQREYGTEDIAIYPFDGRDAQQCQAAVDFTLKTFG